MKYVKNYCSVLALANTAVVWMGYFYASVLATVMSEGNLFLCCLAIHPIVVNLISQEHFKAMVVNPGPQGSLSLPYKLLIT